MKIQETRSWPCTINMGQTGGLPDGIHSCVKKMVAYKANWFPTTPDVVCGCIAIQFVLYDTFQRVCDNFGACPPLPAVTR